MLLQVVVAAEDAQLGNRLTRLLNQPDNIVEQLDNKQFQIEQLGHRGGDVPDPVLVFRLRELT